MTPAPVPPAPSRRTVLCGLAAAVLVPTALAACSSNNTGAGATGSPATGGAAGTPLTPLADVPVGGGVVVDGPVLVVQPTAGQVAAFSAVCPHQGTTVAPPRDGVITCPNHGSQFAADTGELRRGPASTGLTEIPVAVEAEQVVLA